MNIELGKAVLSYCYTIINYMTNKNFENEIAIIKKSYNGYT